VGVELLGKRLDLRFVDQVRAAHKSLSNVQVVEVEEFFPAQLMPGGWFFPIDAWWLVLIEEEGQVCHNWAGDKGLPAEEEKITEGKRWTLLHGFVVSMRRVLTTANAGHAI